MTVPTPASADRSRRRRCNWRHVVSRTGHPAGAAVKADAYGTGVAKVAPALAGTGCRVFFVATLDEGVAQEVSFPIPPSIVVLNGLWPERSRCSLSIGWCPRSMIGSRWGDPKACADQAGQSRLCSISIRA